MPTARQAFVPQPLVGRTATQLRAYVEGTDPVSKRPFMQELIEGLTQPLNDNDVKGVSFERSTPRLLPADTDLPAAPLSEAQALAARAKSYQTPSNVDAPIPDKAPKLSEMKLIAYDFAKYGGADERKRLIARWEKEGAPLKGMAVVGYHKNMSYLNAWLGIREIGSLEPKPGLPPTTAHMSELLARLAKDPAKAVVRSAYNDPRAAEWLTGNAKIPAVVLPFTVGGTDKAKDLFGLFDDTLARLLAVAK